MMQDLLAQDGLFASSCSDPSKIPCENQQNWLSLVYVVGMAAVFLGVLPQGLWYDQYGPRALGFWGALGAGVGLLLLAVPFFMGPTWDKYLCWLTFPAVILTDFSSSANGYSLFGYIWHWPKHQALVLGVANATYQVACFNTFIFIKVVKWYSLPLSTAIAANAAVVVMAALVTALISPGQTELYQKAEEALGFPLPRPIVDLRRGVAESMDAIMNLGTHIWVYFWSQTLPMTWYMYWTSVFSPLIHLVLPADASNLTVMYGSVTGLFGLTIAPFAGWLMDRMGMPRMSVLICLTLVVQLLTQVVPSYSAQLLCQIAGNAYGTLYQTFMSKWYAEAVPPTIWGTVTGLSFSMTSVLMCLVSGILFSSTSVLGGLSQYSLPLNLLGVSSVWITAVYTRLLYKEKIPQCRENRTNKERSMTTFSWVKVSCSLTLWMLHPRLSLWAKEQSGLIKENERLREENDKLRNLCDKMRDDDNVEVAEINGEIDMNSDEETAFVPEDSTLYAKPPTQTMLFAVRGL